MNMKFLLKTPKIFLSLSLTFFLTAYSDQSTQFEKTKSANDFPSMILKLERQEFEESSNLEIKESLARAYWCAGRKGLAVEKWLWLNQFFRNHPRNSQWKKRIKQSSSKSDLLSEELNCSS